MIGLIQRVTGASVESDGQRLGSIGAGLVVLVGFRQGDRAERIPRFVERMLNFRIFADDQGRMNRSVQDIGGGLLLVPQFTLAADTDSGNRPSFTGAAPPDEGEVLFAALVERATSIWPHTAAGRFGADMQVRLVNDGPATFWLEVD